MGKKTHYHRGQPRSRLDIILFGILCLVVALSIAHEGIARHLAQRPRAHWSVPA